MPSALVAAGRVQLRRNFIIQFYYQEITRYSSTMYCQDIPLGGGQEKYIFPPDSPHIMLYKSRFPVIFKYFIYSIGYSSEPSLLININDATYGNLRS